MTAGGPGAGPRPGHLPVLYDEVMEGLAVKSDGTYLDGTFGRGGHARGVLGKLGPRGRLLLMDKDPEAIACAEREFGGDPRVAIFRGSSAELARWDATSGGLDEGGRANQLQLQQAAAAEGARQRVDLVADLFPGCLRVEIEAAGLERVIGEHQAIAGFARDDVPVAGRNGQPALVIDGDGGLALEHCPSIPRLKRVCDQGKPLISRFSHKSPP